MRLIWAVLLVAGCAAHTDTDASAFHAHVSGGYTAIGGMVVGR